MTRVLGGRKLELVCILCNESLADLERACAGLLGNSNKNDAKKGDGDDDAGTNCTTVVSETNTLLADAALGVGASGGGPNQNNLLHFGGYMPLSDQNQKQVVSTKCGHMFHQGCLRKHVHKTLIEGKGGSLFCPMCTRPFAMNRLWPVIIPPTKSQRERYLQLKIMKEQNIEMVKQLKEIRTKISDEEEHLKRIKEDSEQCLHDIQQKQKLLDSVNGPTNKEMAELTKVHMKRQEILHVVTQHNADLLKLLAEESNISTATAENMINVNVKGHTGGRPDPNQNNIFTPTASAFPGEQFAKRVGSGEEYPPTSAISRKAMKKSKKEKSSKKGRGKKKSKRRHHYQTPPSRSKSRQGRGHDDLDQDDTPYFSGSGGGIYPPAPMPSELVSVDGENFTPATNHRHRSHKKLSKKGCKKVDTLSKWKMESMKELMSLPGFSETNANAGHQKKNDDNDDYPTGKSNHHRQGTTQQESVNILLSRKPNMMDNDGFGGLSNNK